MSTLPHRIAAILAFLPGLAIAAGDLPTLFSNQGSVVNTRHNMMQSTFISGPGAGNSTMGAYRNSYGQVCVYCHTPHAADASAAAPLWNRKLPSGSTFTTYTSSSLSGTVGAPGGASLACLSCHDGSQAVDAILNMPGSGGYSTTPNPDSWEAIWTPTSSGGQARTNNHLGLGSTLYNGTYTADGGCLACHNPSAPPVFAAAATDFSIAKIGTDLRNDHPVGVEFPEVTGGTTDWKTPNGSKSVGGGATLFFDTDGDGRLDKGDIRLYRNAAGTAATVECASCHDPHGVPSSSDAGAAFNPTFLRKTNAGSAVCLTCHAK